MSRPDINRQTSPRPREAGEGPDLDARPHPLEPANALALQEVDADRPRHLTRVAAKPHARAESPDRPAAGQEEDERRRQAVLSQSVPGARSDDPAGEHQPQRHPLRAVAEAFEWHCQDDDVLGARGGSGVRLVVSTARQGFLAPVPGPPVPIRQALYRGDTIRTERRQLRSQQHGTGLERPYLVPRYLACEDPTAAEIRPGRNEAWQRDSRHPLPLPLPLRSRHTPRPPLLLVC